MDIKYPNDDDWGRDIGFTCDAILNSECSLAGGFFHVASGSRNLWDDIDHHLWPEEWPANESLVQKFPKPTALRPQTPREKSVSRYLTMSLGKTGDTHTPKKACTSHRTIRVEATLAATQTTAYQNTLSRETKPKSARTQVSSTNSKPYTPGNKGSVNKPKFFHLGDYSGTRPYSVASSYQNRQKSPKMPYFPEIVIKMQSTGTVNSKVESVQVYQRTRVQEIENITTSEKNCRQELMPHVFGKDLWHKPMAIAEQAKTEDFGQNPVQDNNVPAFGKVNVDGSEARKGIKNVEAARKSKVTSPQHVKMVKMKTIADQRESSNRSQREECLQNVVSIGNTKKKLKGFRRLRAALRGLGQRLHSVFTACSSVSRDGNNLEY